MHFFYSNNYEYQVSQDTSPTVDIVALWVAAGRPEHLAPWAWAGREASHRDGAPSLAMGEEREDPVIVPKDVALEYARSLDNWCHQLMLKEGVSLIEADPAGCLIDHPDSDLAWYKVKDVAQMREVGEEEAGEMLIREVVERIADLDPFQQETLVAKVQPAIRDEAPIDVPCWHEREWTNRPSSGS